MYELGRVLLLFERQIFDGSMSDKDYDDSLHKKWRDDVNTCISDVTTPEYVLSVY